MILNSRISLLLLVGATFLSVLLFFSPTDNWIWDPSYYYSQLRSPIIERSFDLRATTLPPNNFRTALGLQPSFWPIGPGLLWSPFFLAADVATRWFGTSLPADGLSWPYTALVSAGSALYGLLGVLVIYRTCRLYTDRSPALIAALLALFATPLFFYTYRQPIMAHSTSVLAHALLLYCVVALDRKLVDFERSGLLLGACVGLNLALRWVGALAALVPALFFMVNFAEALGSRDHRRARQVAGQALVAAGVALAVFAPQFVFWHRVYGAWLINPNPGFARSRLPVHAIDLFVHTNRGLLWWSPAILLGLAGLFRLRPTWLRAAFLVMVGAYAVVLGSSADWFGGGGYGPRYFIELVPLAALGGALLLQPLWLARGYRLALGALATLLVTHQLLLVTVVEQGWLPLQAYFEGAPIGLAYQLEAAKRVLASPRDLLLARPFVGADRQPALVSWLNGGRELQLYRLPLVALLIMPLGLAACATGLRRQHLVPAALALLALTLGWAGFLLII